MNEDIDPDKVDITFDHYPYRGLSAKTVKFYDILTKFHDGVPYQRAFKYSPESMKLKRYGDVPRKQRYTWKGGGDQPGVFGRHLFKPGEFKTIVVTEGEDDAPSVYQAFGGQIASVSVQSSSSALRDVKHDQEFLNSFDRIVLAFDNDEAGQRAVKQVVSAGLFDFNKLCYASFSTHKDANAYLEAGDLEGLVFAVKTAKKYTPDNIISTFHEIAEGLKESKDDVIGTYPSQEMTDLLYGFHRGQVIVVKGLEGIGKTEIFRWMEYHLLKTSTAKLALIHMEEDKSTTIKGLATYELGIPCTLSDTAPSESKIVDAYIRAVGGSEDRVFIYTFFGGDDPDDVLDSMRFLVTNNGVDIVFLDHITLLVQSQEEGDERRKLDYLSTKMKKMAKELKFCLVLISHVNDEGQTRGSRNITKIADTVIDLSRDLLEEDEYQRNLLYVAVEKNRMAGRTGRLRPLYFNTETFKLEETE